MENNYHLLFKTGDAEIRAMEKSNFRGDLLFPIVELTRGRKSKYDKVGRISKRIEKLSSIFRNQAICLDLTAENSLSNEEIEELYDYSEGYSNWLSFLNENKIYFKEIAPTILVNAEDSNLTENLQSQVNELVKAFDTIAYRNNISDGGYLEDLGSIAPIINENENVKFKFIFDCEYVPSGAIHSTIDLVNFRIQKVLDLIPKSEIIVISTSFPRYVSDIGNDNYDKFPLSELDIYNGIKEKHQSVLYGDYGSINPIRNDTVVMARGWIPRIDVPTLEGIYYYRIRNIVRDYAKTYTKVATKVATDPDFPDLTDNWGHKQIISCMHGNAPGSSPSFWISVRMSMFIELQLKRLEET